MAEPLPSLANQNPTNVSASTSLDYGIPDTSAGATFLLEEQAAAAARGESFAQLWSGFKLPESLAGDFWAMYSNAETFAAAGGWKYLPSPKQLVYLAEHGFATAPALAQFQAFANVNGVNLQKMPWMAVGQTQTQWAQSMANMGDTLYGLTGKSSFADAGLGGIENQAIFQQWSPQMIQDYILKNPALSQQYGYLKAGYTYNTYQQYKITNATALKQRYGTQYSDAQAIQSLTDPQTAFHAQGGTFGEFQPYVQSQTTIPTGHQSSVR